MIGRDVPVFDIAPLYQSGDQQDMLVNNVRFGLALASTFSVSDIGSSPEYNVVLMRRHGYTTHGKDIETAIYRAIYTKINALAQTNAIMLRQSFQGISKVQPKFDFGPLTAE